MDIRNSALARCSAPKTARGTAKHKLLNATILSSPRALAISLFAAHSATTKSRMPALHIETTVREIVKRLARNPVFMWMPSKRERAEPGERCPAQYSLELYNEAQESLP